MAARMPAPGPAPLQTVAIVRPILNVTQPAFGGTEPADACASHRVVHCRLLEQSWFTHALTAVGLLASQATGELLQDRSTRLPGSLTQASHKCLCTSADQIQLQHSSLMYGAGAADSPQAPVLCQHSGRIGPRRHPQRQPGTLPSSLVATTLFCPRVLRLLCSTRSPALSAVEVAVAVQDAWAIREFPGSNNCILLGVFDGHGPHGRRVSSALAVDLPQLLVSSNAWKVSLTQALS